MGAAEALLSMLLNGHMEVFGSLDPVILLVFGLLLLFYLQRVISGVADASFAAMSGQYPCIQAVQSHW
jgi:hypothetical protein